MTGRVGRGRDRGRGGRADGRHPRRRARPADPAAGEEPQAGRQDPDVRRHPLQHHPRTRQPRHRRRRSARRASSSTPPSPPCRVQQTVAFFEAEGVATKVEETGKIFPVSNRADRRARRPAAPAAAAAGRRSPWRSRSPTSARPATGFEVVTPQRRADLPAGDPDDRRAVVPRLRHDRRRLRLGGRSSGTRSSRRGRPWCRSPSRPTWVAELRGVTLPDVGVKVLEAGASRWRRRRGGFLFAHFGLSGPVPLDVSRAVSGHPDPQSLELELDFLPAAPGAGVRRVPADRVAGVGQEAARGRAERPAAAPAVRHAAGAVRPAGRPQGGGPEQGGPAAARAAVKRLRLPVPGHARASRRPR